ncbi:type II toxin-antitoxin system VapC family toxin [Capnocytophaga catalasegens]|uniref:PIN domain-containing protein n=1 Tax=Capnocytophaga catalasegens TaxID=1004260 RepID=A0AAV5AUP6_9FLAO|nr:PIN domain-containing protein [Capnocytophaga catalasegens]GIZ14026.1 hypothetical protein RCZ03_00270 [Capnocytophaga catalasegens]GJM51089.1 hypothetical protein RCZ15_20620 [Capnocytophaga catalasegens]GJM54101.1 hypothetical protein RCZ16_24170 [Capnocytophaga catalasegens]
MRYLLDTNIILILFQGREKEIRKEIAEILENEKNKFFASIISLNEIIQLYRKKKIKGIDYDRYDTPLKFLKSIITQLPLITYLPFEEKHSLKVATLNFVPKHKDPNDLAIIAHAMSKKMTIISTDDLFPAYQKQGAKVIHNKR